MKTPLLTAAMRTQLLINVCGLAVCLAMTPLFGADLPTAVLRVETDAKLAQIPFLSWDTEDGRRAQANLLRPDQGCRLHVLRDKKWVASTDLPVQAAAPGATETTYRLGLGTGSEIVWRVARADDRLRMSQAVLLREESFRRRYYRPLTEAAASPSPARAAAAPAGFPNVP